MRQAESIGTRILLPGVVAAVATLAVAAPPDPRDPWAIVPALPTGWYSEKDDFAEKLNAAKEANAKALERQEKTNAELTDRVKALDMTELQTRMQTFMMEHPEQAMKLMQEIQAAGTKVTNTQVEADATLKPLSTELIDLGARYKKALEGARTPVDQKFKELDVRAQKDLVAFGETWVYAPWAVKEYDALVVQWNAASDKVFAEWWPPSGPYQGWLNRFRQHLATQIPSWEEADAAAAGLMVHLVETPESSFRSTAKLRAVRDYIEQVARVYENRERQPKPPMSTAK